MPKDKTSIEGFASAADYSAKETSEMKAEPQDESEIICYYFTRANSCPGPMGDERHYMIKNGNMVMAHKQCHKRDQDGEKKTPNVIIR